MKQNNFNKIAYFGRVIWLYTKYQLLTKGVLFFLVFPLASWFFRLLLQSTGRTSISSGDYLKFLLSFQGLGFLILTFALLTLLIGIDVNAFIITSALLRKNRIAMTARQVFQVAILSLKNFMKPAGLVIMLYVAIIIPILGIGITISPVQGFEIPNFITDVIFKNPLYLSLYLFVLSLLFLVTLRYFFFFHYLLLIDNDIPSALKKSAKLMARHWKRFLYDFLLYFLGLTILGAIAIFLFLFAFLLPVSYYRLSPIWTAFGLLTVAELISFFGFLSVPIVCDRLTVLFFRYHEIDGNSLSLNIRIKVKELGEAANKKVKTTTKLKVAIFLVLTLVFNVTVSYFYSTYLHETMKHGKSIEIVAHRGGGDLAAENTIASLEAVIEENIAWSEIDVQRTKDDKYIINHDSTFARLSGINKASSDMTLEEIKRLKVNDLFDTTRPAQPVATIEEFLDAAKGKIGLYIELKGSTADTKMVDDLVAMVVERQMEKEVALLSLDYSLIEYIENTYPEIDSGYLYFFAIGDIAKLKGDILIMEEREATPEKIRTIHNAGKKAVVWTVNTEESIDKFVKSEIDGIITDYVLKVKEGILKRDNRTDLEIMIDNLLN